MGDRTRLRGGVFGSSRGQVPPRLRSVGAEEVSAEAEGVGDENDGEGRAGREEPRDGGHVGDAESVASPGDVENGDLEGERAADGCEEGAVVQPAAFEGEGRGADDVGEHEVRGDDGHEELATNLLFGPALLACDDA